MNPISRTPRAVTQPRRGFTLVEQLVAVALVLLLMTLFAQIFATATGALSTQRGLAENDQRARRLQTTLSNDLKLGTYQARQLADGIVPLLALPNADAIANPPTTEERGYFYISENDPDNDTDDVLQFTMRAEDSESPFFGKATFVPTSTDLNQPEADDGTIDYIDTDADTFPDTFVVVANSQGSSPFMEVAYFLRGSNLYRRTHLIREPLDDGTAVPAPLDGNNDYTSPPPAPARVFWNDFDYSAFYKPAGGVVPQGLHIPIGNTGLAASILLNSVKTNGAETVSMGLPKYRFGFWGDFNTASPGAPREFLDSTETLFFGRFTHQETSDPDFGYPGIDVTGVTGGPAGTNYYMNSLVTDGTVDMADANNDAVIDGLEDGTRRSEDIVLSNVHAFDIQVFDGGSGDQLNAAGEVTNPGTGAFENLGHSRTDDVGPNDIGDYNINNNNNVAYGNRFDTWHVDQDAIGANQTPYRPATVGPDGQNGVV